MSELSGRQLALRWVLLLVAVIVSALAIRAAIQLARQPVYHDIPYTSGAVDDRTPLQQPIGLPTDRQGLDAWLSQPGNEPTDAEPADLPPYHGAVNLMRFRRTDHRLIEHVSIWSIRDVNVQVVASYYQQAAQGVGFAHVGEDRTSPDVIGIDYVRDREALTVRCRQAGSDVRVVLQLRYTVAD